MNRKIILGIALLAPVLMGQQSNGCNTQQLPSVAQIELEIPDELRRCPGFPKSPGKAATDKQRAVYIIELYNALAVCKGNMAARDRIYAKYRVEIQAAKGAGLIK